MFVQFQKTGTFNSTLGMGCIRPKEV